MTAPRPEPHDHRRAGELTRLLADASLLPAGVRTSDVGGYRALEVVARGPGHYWATADLFDEEGSGHLEITVATASSMWPPTLAELRKQLTTTGVERRQADGSTITVCTTSSGRNGVITGRAILVRPDRTYIDVLCRNEDSRTSGPTRLTSPVDAEAVLNKIANLRP